MSSLFRLTRISISSPFLHKYFLNRASNYVLINRPSQTLKGTAIPFVRFQGTTPIAQGETSTTAPPSSSSSSQSQDPTSTDETDLMLDAISDSQRNIRLLFSNLEKNMSRFEDRCERTDRVSERDFIRTFDTVTRIVEKLESLNQMTDYNKLKLALPAKILLRCCGKIMEETPSKTRELLAGNLWHFIKEKKIPLDISHYNSLIRALNENQTVFDPMKLLEEIKEANLKVDMRTYQRLIHQYCLQGDIDGATRLLEVMKDEQMNLNEVTFASLIIGYSKQEQPPSIKEMFDLMKSNKIQPSGRSYTAALISLAQLLQKDATTAKSELELVRDGIEKDAIKFTLNEQLEINSSLNPVRDDETVSKILKIINQNQSTDLKTRYKLISTLLKNNQFAEASELYWSRKPSDRSLAAGDVGVYYIRLLASHKNIPLDDVIRECERMKQAGHCAKPIHLLYFHAADCGNLNLVREVLKILQKEESIKVLYLWPLLAQAKDEDEIVTVLKNDFNPKMDMNDMLDTFSMWVWPKFSNPTRLFELNKDLQFNNNLLAASYLNYAFAEGKLQDAIEFVTNYRHDFVSGAETKIQDDEDEIYFRSNRQSRLVRKEALVGRLLRQIADETKDAELVEKAFRLCLSYGTNISSKTVSPLVRMHLVNNDFDRALEEFIRLANEFRVTPCKTDLMIHCLKTNNPDSLQKIMDIATDLYGESNALFDLAVACLRIGKNKQAQKIFDSPGFRVSQSRIDRLVDMLKTENIKVLLPHRFYGSPPTRGVEEVEEQSKS